MLYLVGAPGFEPGITPTPWAHVSQLHYAPQGCSYLLFLCIALIHLAQAKTRFPEGNFTHCKFGYFLCLEVGLYFPRNFLSVQATVDFLPQITHSFAIPSISTFR